MFDQFYLNDDGEKVFFHEEMGMLFQWMEPADIKRFSKGLTAKDHYDDIISSLDSIVNGNDVHILGMSVVSSREFGKKRNSHCNIVFCMNGIFYDNYKITGLKTKISKIENGVKFKPSFSYTNENYYYYINKLANLEERGCSIHLGESLTNGINSVISFTYSDGKTLPRRINDIIGKTNSNVSYFIDGDERKIKATNRCDELEYTFMDVFKNENNRYCVKYKCDKGHINDGHDYYAFVGKQQQKCGDCSQLETHSFGHNDCKEILRSMYITVREKSFEDLKLKKPLPYDFFVKSLNLLVEYDGSNHFDTDRISAWHDPDRIIKDRMKNDYAKDKGYNFIRIKHTEEHQESLKSFLALVLKHPDKQIVQIYGEVQILDKQ